MQDHVLDISNVVALRQIVITAVIDQADAAYVDGLLPDANFSPPDV